MIKSLTKEYRGYLKVAGRFFSNMKWPVQANPYPINKARSNREGLRFMIALSAIKITKVVPMKCSILFVLLECSER